MQLLGLLLEHWSPHLLIVAATLGMFVALGALVLAAILFENWYEASRQRREQRAFERQRPLAETDRAGRDFVITSTAKAS